MTDPRSRAAPPVRAALLAGLALALLGAMALMLTVGAVPADPADPTTRPIEQAESLALTMLACGVAALAIVAGIAALALERSLDVPPATQRRIPAASRQSPEARATPAFRKAA